MRDACYLIVSQYGVERMCKRTPRLARGEVAIKLRVTVPDACLRSPIIAADLNVPEDHVIPTCEVTSERPGVS